MDILYAVSELYGDCLQDEQGNIFVGDTPITQTQLSEATTKAEALQAEYDANQYQRDRAKDYPPMEEQLDYIYHNGVEAWKTDMILPVKTKYPKGGSK